MDTLDKFTPFDDRGQSSDQGSFADGVVNSNWVDDAANKLFRDHPELSAKAKLTQGQIVFLTVIGFAGFFAVILSATLTFKLLQLVAVVYFGALIVFRLLTSAFTPGWAARTQLADDDLPIITVLAPVFREHRVLPQLTAALYRMDYPIEKLDIKIVLEACDTTTIRRARQQVNGDRFELIIVPEGTPQTKPRALNYALRFARGSIITVYDAEDIPHPGQLRAAAEAFAAGDDRLACVQAPLNWYNGRENWLTRQFVLEYANQFLAILPFLAMIGWPLPLGGTSNHFRRDALEKAGGWDAYNVTEDADLGFRLARFGYRCGVIPLPTMEEAPENLRAWLKQRTRWLKGYIQTLAVQLRHPEKLSLPIHLSLGLTIGAATISALIHMPVLLIGLALMMTGYLEGMLLPVGGLLVCGYAASMLSAGVAAKRGGYALRLVDLISMPFYWPLQTIAAICAMAELKFKPYFWAKTEHGFTFAPEIKCHSNSP